MIAQSAIKSECEYSAPNNIYVIELCIRWRDLHTVSSRNFAKAFPKCNLGHSELSMSKHYITLYRTICRFEELTLNVYLATIVDEFYL